MPNPQVDIKLLPDASSVGIQNASTVIQPYVIYNNAFPTTSQPGNITKPTVLSTFGVTLTDVDTGSAKDGLNLKYVVIPLGALLFIAVFTFVVIMILRKSKMDKLRHHLMPLYNFDPTEEEGDWENELLEEDKEQQVALNYNARSPMGGPQLKFHQMDRIV